MKIRDFATSVIAFVGMSGFAFYFAAADLSHMNPIAHPESVAAVLINNDVSELHCGNIHAAEQACRAFPFDEIVSLGGGEDVPALADVCSVLEDLQQRNVRVGLLYLTGHGSVYRSRHLPDGESCVMLKDRPLRVAHLVGKLGMGPCVIYTDVCYSPGLLTIFGDRLQGDFLVLTDKPAESPELSCRGVSTDFWDCLRNYRGERTTKGAFWEASLDAWQQACSRGNWIQIGNRPIRLSYTKSVIIDQEKSKQSTRAGVQS